MLHSNGDVLSTGVDKPAEVSDDNFLLAEGRETNGLLVINPDGEVVYQNAAAASLLESRDPEVIRAWLRMDDPQYAQLNRVYISPTGGTMEVWVTPVTWQGQSAYLVILHNMTDNILLKKVVSQTSEGVLVMDANNVISFVNAAFSRISGYSPQDVIGRTPAMFSSGRHDQAFFQAIVRRLKSNGEWQGEIWNRRKNGEIYPEWLRISVVKDTTGKIVQYVAVCSDLSARKQDEVRLKHLANHDALTGLPNRVLFKDRLQVALAHARRNQTKLAIMYFDLDRFKYINDSLGHDIGDHMLTEVALRLLSTVREDDTVARMGGDEFTLLFPGIHAAEDAAMIAQKVVDSLKEPFYVGEREIYITASIGVALYPADGDHTEELLGHADAAMYRAIEQGGDNVQFYTPSINDGAIEKMDLEQGLRHALDHGEFFLYYQPQLNLVTGQISGVEALLRWQNPKFDLVPPVRFIPVAEATGMIIPIGDWVLRMACAQNVLWQQMGYPPIRMAVNLSARQFQQGNLVQKVADILTDTGLEPRLLELEVTESVAMHDVEFTVKTLQEFKQMGVHIAIDDFGTGYSSLTYLKKFPINTLKIDQTFIGDSMSNAEDAAIVSSILVLARSLEYKAVAEGVETMEQMQFLRERDCDEIQGYLFGRPMPASDLEQLFLKNLRQ